MSAAALVALLRDPGRATQVAPALWPGIVAAARAERLLGTLAARLDGLALPETVAAVLADARLDAGRERRQALWEADRAALALRDLRCPVILLKGTAYVAAGLSAGRGRMIGDLDILVPRERIGAVEAALLAAGWEWVKPDPYDDAYYRRWMHELPPLIHRERDRMIDVHHAILPLTARIRPDMGAMIAQAQPIGGGLHVLDPLDRICHAAAHMLADGALEGGLRNLWDIHCLIGEDGGAPGFWRGLEARARHHGLRGVVRRAARLAEALYGTELPEAWAETLKPFDLPCLACLLARDEWGRARRPVVRQMFYIRSHWLRMPPLLLARHLFVKWRKGRG
jgi:hypothetical protein